MDLFCKEFAHPQDLSLKNVDRTGTDIFELSYPLDDKTSVMQNHTVNDNMFPTTITVSLQATSYACYEIRENLKVIELENMLVIE